MKKRWLVFCLVVVLPLLAQTYRIDVIYGPAYLPSTLGTLVPSTFSSGNLLVDGVQLINRGSTDQTVVLQDGSTNCNNGPCALVPDGITVAAKTEFYIPKNGTPMLNGIYGSASASNAIQCVIFRRR